MNRHAARRDDSPPAPTSGGRSLPTPSPAPFDLTTDHAAIQIGIGATTLVAAIAVAGTHSADPTVAILLSVAVLCFGWLSIVDTAEQRLPNRITLPLAAATMLAVLAGGLARSDLGASLGALGVGVVFAFALIVLRFGVGDAKMALTIGMIAGWLGRDAVMTTAYVGAITGAVVALTVIAVHRRRDVSFGFGPCLALGSVAGMLVSGT